VANGGVARMAGLERSLGRIQEGPVMERVR